MTMIAQWVPTFLAFSLITGHQCINHEHSLVFRTAVHRFWLTVLHYYYCPRCRSVDFRTTSHLLCINTVRSIREQTDTGWSWRMFYLHGTARRRVLDKYQYCAESAAIYCIRKLAQNWACPSSHKRKSPKSNINAKVTWFFLLRVYFGHFVKSNWKKAKKKKLKKVIQSRALFMSFCMICWCWCSPLL